MAEEASLPAVYNTSSEVMADQHATFEAFFHDERDHLFGLLCLMTGNRHDADDLAQEAFIALWERWDDVGTIDDPVAYLRTVAVNAFRKRLRRAEVARRLTGRRSTFAVASPEDTVILHDALRVLSPRQRAALVLTELLGYSGDEAAKALGVKRSTIGALKYQGRAALKNETELADD